MKTFFFRDLWPKCWEARELQVETLNETFGLKITSDFASDLNSCSEKSVIFCWLIYHSYTLTFIFLSTIHFDIPKRLVSQVWKEQWGDFCFFFLNRCGNRYHEFCNSQMTYLGLQWLPCDRMYSISFITLHICVLWSHSALGSK